MELTAVYQKVAGGYVAFVEELPGANTQGTTLNEARENLVEAVELVLETNRQAGKTSTVPRHAEIFDHLARKICKDLDIPFLK